MSEVSLPADFLAAAEALVGDRDRALVLLGVSPVLPNSALGRDAPRATTVADRVGSLLIDLQEMIKLRAMELEEFGEESDIARLRNEAVGILLAIREVRHYFPECLERVPTQRH